MQPLLQPNQIIAQRYKMIRQIGGGGMSIVYEVFDQRLEKNWAMKEMFIGRFSSQEQQDMIKIFDREAKILAGLRHPKIPFVADYFVDGQSYYIVMDLIDGEDLQSVLENQPQGKIDDLDKTINWGIQVAEIIEYLHSQNPPVLYRDLKPSNIMLTKDNKIMLTDFGIAGLLRGVSQQQSSGKITKQQTIAMGSPGFSPPEQYTGNTDERSDIYSLGATLHYLVTGVDPEKNPFQFEPLKTLRPDASNELEQIIFRATQATASQRIQNASEFRHSLDNLLVAKVAKAVGSAFGQNLAQTNFVPDQTVLKMFKQIQIPKINDGLGSEQKKYRQENLDLFESIQNYYQVGDRHRAIESCSLIIYRFKNYGNSTEAEKKLLDMFYWFLGKFYEESGNFQKSRECYLASIYYLKTNRFVYQDLRNVEQSIKQSELAKKQAKKKFWQNIFSAIVNQFLPKNIANLFTDSKHFTLLMISVYLTVVGSTFWQMNKMGLEISSNNLFWGFARIFISFGFIWCAVKLWMYYSGSDKGSLIFTCLFLAINVIGITLYINSFTWLYPYPWGERAAQIRRGFTPSPISEKSNSPSTNQENNQNKSDNTSSRDLLNSFLANIFYSGERCKLKLFDKQNPAVKSWIFLMNYQLV